MKYNRTIGRNLPAAILRTLGSENDRRRLVGVAPGPMNGPRARAGFGRTVGLFAGSMTSTGLCNRLLTS